eukprot:GHVN01060936.1.p1 GENE.GHVN01060936.1~~GHVN01060936.1.p1  ORF type:complete len:211 (+),score=49.86 GHVN01060936.1:352-984(+)
MGKNWKDENTKSVEARTRKNQANEIKQEETRKQKEDAAWEDDHKLTKAKMDRKAEEISKAEQKQARRLEAKELYETEQKAITHSIGKKGGESTKMTKAEIQRRMLAAEMEKMKPKEDTPAVITAAEFGADFNRMNSTSATNVDAALEALADQAQPDQHPEKRAKAAYKAYEAREMENLKQEFPKMTRSQLMERCWKQWQKAPENPFNQQA